MNSLFPSSLQQSESHLLLEIEDLVSDINRYPVPEWMKPSLTRRLAVIVERLMNDLPRLCSVYQADMEYTATIDAFWIACLRFDLIGIHGFTGYPLTYAVIRNLCADIARHGSGDAFRQQQLIRLSQVQKNQRELQGYVAEILQRYSKTLVVRVDLSIVQQYQQHIDIVQFRVFWRRFCRKMEDTGIFRDKLGFIWCIEQGRTKGYHIHLALFYAGRAHRSGWFMARECIRIWQAITNGMGYGFNCHDSNYLDVYREKGTLGVEMIHRDNFDQVQHCIRTLSYLADPDKEGQYLRVRPRGMRVFGKGTAEARSV